MMTAPSARTTAWAPSRSCTSSMKRASTSAGRASTRPRHRRRSAVPPRRGPPPKSKVTGPASLPLTGTRRVDLTFTHRVAPDDLSGRSGGGASFLDVLLRRFPYHTADEWLERIADGRRSEEHTSELQSRENLVCRL